MEKMQIYNADTSRNECSSIADDLGIEIESLKNIKISECSFSVRLENALRREYKTDKLYDIAKIGTDKIKKTRGLGTNSINELIQRLKSIGESKEVEVEIDERIDLHNFAQKYKSELINGNISKIDEQLANINEKKQLEALVSIYNDLGEGLVNKCLEQPETIFPLLKAFNEFVAEQKRIRRIKERIREAINCIPIERQTKKSKHYIEVYGYNKKELNDIFNKGDNALNNPAEVNNDQVNILLRFYKWCSFDIQKALFEIAEKGWTNERTKHIIRKRSEGATLEQVGLEFDITRERVRQIEAKAARYFVRWLNSKRILEFICADNLGIKFFTKDNLTNYFQENVDLFIYLLLVSKISEFKRYEKYDIYSIYSEESEELLNACVDALPERFYEEEKQKLIETLSFQFNLPKSILDTIIKGEYNHSGAAVYSRNTVSLKDIYVEQIGKYFPKGIHVYDANDIQKLKGFIIKNYGEEKIAKTDRAIAARVADVCILCGKGIYKVKQNKYISARLKNKIYKYISESEHQIFLTNTIFSVFEEELKREGVDNKYYLQGIIKEEFGDKFYTRRDYVSKNKELTSVYDEIYAYVRRSKYPVSKEDLKNKFPGITEIVLNLALSATGILNLFGSYIHVDNLAISEEELNYIKNVAKNICSDNLTHHVKDVFAIAKIERADILAKNYIKYAHDLYSLLEWALSDEGYQFDRPYMAKQGINMVHPKDALNEYIINSDEISIKEIMDFAHDDYIMIQSILEFLNTFNDTHFFKDDKNLIKIEKTGLTEEIYGLVEERMMKEVVETIPIAKLNCVHEFEKINIQWTEWLIYSAVNKWSGCLEVAASDKELRKSIPLIAPKGELEVTNKYNKSTVGTISNVDDLTNIEELVSEYIFEEMEMLWDNEF